MSRTRPTSRRKFFTVEQANATLPLVRCIIRDVTELACRLHDKQERLADLTTTDRLLDAAEQQELDECHRQIEQGVEQMRELQGELAQIGVQLKDFSTGLIDFPCWLDGREVYLCWRHGEPEVAWWHEIEAGFAGRQQISLTPGAFQ